MLIRLVPLFLLLLIIFVSHAQAEKKEDISISTSTSLFDTHISIMERNFVEDTDVTEKLEELSSANLEEFGMQKDTINLIKDFWFYSAAESCDSFSEKVININLKNMTPSDLKNKVKFQEKWDKVDYQLDMCKYRYYLSNWEKIKKMIDEKYNIYACKKSQKFSLKRILCTLSIS